jgi:prepilin-type N-terminal cleavage/methylation domain-containing protein
MRKAFTLVELAIVIVIIGLLVAGVLTGRELIEQAKITKVISDIKKYNAAMETFRAKYNAVPGDMKKAYSFFSNGDDNICGINNTNPADTAATNYNGCNGNGNNLVGGVNDMSEAAKVWVHLTLANIVPGLMTYKPDIGYRNLIAQPKDSATAPPSSIAEDAVYDFFFSGRLGGGGGTIHAYNQTGLWMTLATPSPANPWLDRFRIGNTVTPTQAYNIDIKMDDGLPTLGSVISARSSFSTYMGACGSVDISSSNFNTPAITPSASITYDTASVNRDKKSCVMLFKTGFF